METNSLKKKIYKRWWFWVIVIIILIIILSNGKDKTQVTENTPTTNSQNQDEQKTEPVIESIKITAIQLIADYKANEVSADAKYKDKVLEVTGTVDKIGKDILDNPFITLTDGKQYSISNVQCMFSNKDEAELVKVSNGQKITLKGVSAGLSLLNPLMRECSIVK